MKNQELYNKTVDILVNAYLNDILKHGNCKACAVGNIIATNCGITNILSSDEWVSKAWGIPNLNGWTSVFITINGSAQSVSPSNYKDVAKLQIDSTGYTWQELAKIEFAFETAPKGNSEDEWMFNGLIKVLDVLEEIHEVNKEISIISKNKIKNIYGRNLERYT